MNHSVTMIQSPFLHLIQSGEVLGKGMESGSSLRNRPRVVLLTYPGLYGAAVIEKMGEADGVELVGVGLSHRIFKGKGYLATVRTMVERTGLAYTTYSFLITDFAWSLLWLTGRPRALSRLRPNVRYLHDINARDTIEWLTGLSPDFVASCYFNQLIGPEVRALPRQRCVNMHPALLPALRGPDPCFRTIERGLDTTGLTIHAVDATFDTGVILYQETRPVPNDVSLLGLNMRLWSEGAELLAGWLAGNKIGTPTPQHGDDYSSWPTPLEVRRFRVSGHKLLTLSKLVRAIRSFRTQGRRGYEPA